MEDDVQFPRILTLKEAADLMQVSQRTLIRIVSRKQFPAFKVGRQWRFVEADLAKWIEALDEL